MAIMIPATMRHASSGSWGASMEPHYRCLMILLVQNCLPVEPDHCEAYVPWGLHWMSSNFSSLGRDDCHGLHGDLLSSEVRQLETEDPDTESPLASGAEGALLPGLCQHPSRSPECFLLHSMVEGFTLTDLSRSVRLLYFSSWWAECSTCITGRIYLFLYNWLSTHLFKVVRIPHRLPVPWNLFVESWRTTRFCSHSVNSLVTFRTLINTHDYRRTPTLNTSYHR